MEVKECTIIDELRVFLVASINLVGINRGNPYPSFYFRWPFTIYIQFYIVPQIQGQFISKSNNYKQCDMWNKIYLMTYV